MFFLTHTRQGRLMVAVLLALPACFLAVMYAYPLYRLISISLRDFQPTYGYDNFVGVRNYVEVLSSAATWLTIGRTFVYTFICVIANLVLALSFAALTVALARQFSERLGHAFRQVVILPMILIPAAAGVMWSFSYTEHYGWVNSILVLIGVKPFPWLVSQGAFYLVMLTDIWGWTPFLYLILLSAMQSLPEEPLEAARIDGANSWQVFWYVTLPMMKPVIAVAVTIKALDTYRAFDYLWIMTNGGPGTASTTLNVLTYKTAFSNFDFGKASALGLITMLFPAAVVLVSLALKQRKSA